MDELRKLLLALDRCFQPGGRSRSDMADIQSKIQDCVTRMSLDPASLELLEQALNAEKTDLVYAAAYVLLRIDAPKATDLLIQALLGEIGPDRLQGIGRALVESPTDHLPLELLLDAASPEVGSVIRLALVAQGRAVPGTEQIESYLNSESGQTRSRAWQLIALLGSENAI